MNADEFRSLAMSMPEAAEVGHMGHPDFRVRGKIFATLGYPDAGWGVLKLTPEEQRFFVRVDPAIFRPVPGGWGKKGSTNVRLGAATDDTVRPAVIAAWRNVAPKRLAKEHEDTL